VTPSTFAKPQANLDARHAWFSSLVLGYLVFLTLIGQLLSIKPQPFTGEGNPMRQLFYILALGLAIWAARGLAQPRRLLVLPVSMTIALLWCLLSVSWALAPSISIRRLILTISALWSVFIVVRNAGFERSVRAIQIMLVVGLVLNYAAIVISPGTAIHQPGQAGGPELIGNWRGVLPHKNFAGAICAMTIIYFGLAGQRLKIVYKLAIMLAAAFFLYKTASKTSMGFTAAAMVAGWMANRYNPRYRSIILPLALVVIACAVMFGQEQLAALLSPFSRQDALTGRVQIWPILVNYARDHWLLGSGYGSFWNIGGDSPVFHYARSWVKELGNGHNGYLDLLVQIGVPGLLLTVFATMFLPLGKLFASQGMVPQRRGFLIAVILFCMGHNLTESSLMDRDAIVQMFLMMAVALTQVATRDEVRFSPAGRPATQVRRQAASAATDDVDVANDATDQPPAAAHGAMHNRALDSGRPAAD